jgi:hypothetical protein
MDDPEELLRKPRTNAKQMSQEKSTKSTTTPHTNVPKSKA